jgi:cytochrome c oxidase subunit 4
MSEHVEHAAPAAADPHDHGDHALGHDNSPEAIKKEIRKYLYVFGALAVLTIITVAISTFHLPTHEAIALALIVAAVKASLVAAFFMHLLSERKLIFAVLAITVFFFGMMIWGPSHHHSNAEYQWPGYDLNAHKPPPPEHGAAEHGSGH